MEEVKEGGGESELQHFGRFLSSLLPLVLPTKPEVDNSSDLQLQTSVRKTFRTIRKRTKKQSKEAHLSVPRLEHLDRLRCDPPFPLHELSLDELNGSSLDGYESHESDDGEEEEGGAVHG